MSGPWCCSGTGPGRRLRSRYCHRPEAGRQLLLMLRNINLSLRQSRTRADLIETMSSFVSDKLSTRRQGAVNVRQIEGLMLSVSEKRRGSQNAQPIVDMMHVWPCAGLAVGQDGPCFKHDVALVPATFVAKDRQQPFFATGDEMLRYRGIGNVEIAIPVDDVERVAEMRQRLA